MRIHRPARALVAGLATTAAVLATLAMPAWVPAGGAEAGAAESRYQTASLRFAESAPGRATG